MGKLRSELAWYCISFAVAAFLACMTVVMAVHADELSWIAGSVTWSVIAGMQLTSALSKTILLLSEPAEREKGE